MRRASRRVTRYSIDKRFAFAAVQHMPPPVTLDSRQWRGCRAQDINRPVGARSHKASQPVGNVGSCIRDQRFLESAHNNIHQLNMWWVGWCFSNLRLVLGKGLEIVLCGRLKSEVRWSARLDQYAPSLRPTPSAPSYLSYQLESSFWRSKIRKVLRTDRRALHDVLAGTRVVRKSRVKS